MKELGSYSLIPIGHWLTASRAHQQLGVSGLKRHEVKSKSWSGQSWERKNQDRRRDIGGHREHLLLLPFQHSKSRGISPKHAFHLYWGP